jgi:biotin-(acetyl-CoA carboxylase) ligase
VQALGGRMRGVRSWAVQRSPTSLERLGLRLGEPIRFRRHDRGRWVVGRVAGIAADGSITLRDPDGSARSLRPDRVEIRRPGTRGRLRWCTASDVAITWEQLELFAP